MCNGIHLNMHSRQQNGDDHGENLEVMCCAWIPKHGRLCANQHSLKNDCSIWWSMCRCQYSQWAWTVKDDNSAMMNLNDNSRSVQPVTTKNIQPLQAHMGELIHANLCVKHKDTAIILGIFDWESISLSTKCLRIGKYVLCVPRMLTWQMK